MIAVLLPMGKSKAEQRVVLYLHRKHCVFSCLFSNINGDVLATFRVIFRVSRVHQYSDSFVQDLLRAGLSSAMHGKPLEVPEFGEINGIILLGSETIQSSFNCLRPCSWMKAVGVINWFA